MKKELLQELSKKTPSLERLRGMFYRKLHVAVPEVALRRLIDQHGDEIILMIKAIQNRHLKQ